jgi:RNA polymerase sigma-70 factor (ECF subfamily)
MTVGGRQRDAGSGKIAIGCGHETAVRSVPGDDEWFGVLFDAHFGDLWRFARRRCGADDADDVAAQVFAIAWRRRHDLPDGGEVRSWLFGVARGVLANQRRSDARQDRLRRRLTAFHGGDHDGSPDVSDGELRLVLGELSDDERAVVLMRCWDELTVGEIATVLGCSPNAVSIRLHRVRRRIAAKLAAKELAVDGHVPAELERRKEQSHGRR